MALTNIVLPKMGEGVEEATITRWFVEEGETVQPDDVIVEIATDKVDSEIPTPVSGVVKQINFKVDDVARVGEVLAVIITPDENERDEDDEHDQSVQVNDTLVFSDLKETTLHEAGIIAGDINKKSFLGTPDVFLSPLVKSIVEKEAISNEEFGEIRGTGRDGRVTKDDIYKYLSGTKRQPETEVLAKTENERREITISNEDEIVVMDRMRKLIANHMLSSKQISPHVTSVVEADVTNIVLWRNRNREAFESKHGTKLTFMPLFTEAVAKALHDFPGVNASVDGDKIILRKNINIGIAVVLPSGNLIVPVVKQADQMNIAGLAQKINQLAEKARNSRLLPEDIQGGTFTLTNVGTFGNIMGTPIINQPQVAILAVGLIEKKPAVVETPTGDVIAIRYKMYLSLSYDHRIVDGALGGRFLKRISDYLEGFDLDAGL